MILDVFSRRVVGWAMADHMRKDLVTDALDIAIFRRKPLAVVHHSDQGSSYMSIAFAERCKSAGIQASMGSRGDCYDNAMCESFNATLECELRKLSTIMRPDVENDCWAGLSSHAASTCVAAWSPGRLMYVTGAKVGALGLPRTKRSG